jgi:NAD(P)-dependent dehydrogenase (short-subunit alcohol dehydrogenase family)
MVARTLERFGRLDVLINSAAMDRNLTRSTKQQAPTPLKPIPSKLAQGLDVNLTGMFLAPRQPWSQCLRKAPA